MSETLTASQSRLQEDLRGLIAGDVRCDDVVLQLYSSDGSPYEERPQCVVWPRSTQDVASVVQYAAECGLSVHPRGSGSSGTCGAIGNGIVVDLSRYTRRLLQSGDDYVCVQPGAVRERVNELLRTTKGRFFAPSSGHVPTGTIGSILAVDNIGPRWLRYGAPHESVLELKVVSASGELWTLHPFRSVPCGDSLDPNAARKRRLRFLNAAIAETSETVDEWDDRPENGVELAEGWRSFRSERIRAEFFKRTFGEKNVDELLQTIRREPFAKMLRVLREYEPWLDVEERVGSPSRCGYPLRGVLRDGFDPTRLFVGTEGTLGIIVEAKVSTFAISAYSSAVILLFDSLDKATRAVPSILKYRPTLCDLLDSRVIALTKDWDARFEAAFPQGGSSALVVELDDDSDVLLKKRMDDLTREARSDLGVFGVWTAYSREEKSLFRDLLRRSSCARLRMAPSFQYFPFWEDFRIPVESIPDFLKSANEIFRREHIVYTIGGFIGVGQLSIQPILPYSQDEERRAFVLSEEFESLIMKFGGEVGVAKGNGRARTATLPLRFPNLFPAFVSVKDAFDPEKRLNPDCVVSPEMRRLAMERASARVFGESLHKEKKDVANGEENDFLAPETEAALRESSLRGRALQKRTPYDLERLESLIAAQEGDRPQIEFQISWDPSFAFAPAYQCIGCGHCRIRTAETRMCPAFRNEPDEQSSCRAKANLMRGALDGKLSLDTLMREDAKRVADRCLRCHCCDVECAAQVDAARLSFRLTSAYRAAVGLGIAELFAVRADLFLNFFSRFAAPIDRGLQNGTFRWILEKILGVARGRKTPLLEREPFLKRLKKSDRVAAYLAASDGVRRKIALFVDSYANFFDVALVETTIKLFELNGAAVAPIQYPRTSGMVAFAIGDVDRAEIFSVRNVSVLRELVRDGSEIVALEPTTAVCIKKEYPYFCNDDDAKIVYENTTDACSYLARLLSENEFRLDALKPISEERLCVAYHAPCRSVALSGEALAAPTAAQKLLEKIPNLEVKRLERGCCGFSGFSGFTTRRFEESLRLSSRLILATRNPDVDMCATECSFCALQLVQGVKKPVAHALKLLAVSAGLITLEEACLKAYSPRRPALSSRARAN